jgi:hypothetical protein
MLMYEPAIGRRHAGGEEGRRPAGHGEDAAVDPWDGSKLARCDPPPKVELPPWRPARGYQGRRRCLCPFACHFPLHDQVSPDKRDIGSVKESMQDGGG